MTTNAENRVPRLLHVSREFAADAVLRGRTAFINHLGRSVAHSVATVTPAATSAMRAIHRGVPVSTVELPGLAGPPGPVRLQALAAAMRDFDLVLTHGWAARNAVLAHTLFGPRMGLPPLIHHEDRFEDDERDRLKPSRNALRILALARAQALVVPSPRLEQVAVSAWKQPPNKIHRIPPSADCAACQAKPKADALPRVIKRRGELFLGTFAHLQTAESLRGLVATVADLDEAWHLVILGETPDAEQVLSEAVRLEVGHRVHLPGPIAEPARVLGLLDLFTLAFTREQFPVVLAQAMAAGLAVAGADVGDAHAMVGVSNRRYLAPPDKPEASARGLVELAVDPALRAAVGAENLAFARAEYDSERVFARQARLYAQVLGRERFP